MKKVLFAVLFMCCVMFSFAQSEERVKPTLGVKLERDISFALIEKDTYTNVVVELNAADFGDIFTEGVKVTVKDAGTGKKIFKKRFSKSYLYAYSNGTIIVGKGNALTQLIIQKTESNGLWVMEIKEKGIY